MTLTSVFNNVAVQKNYKSFGIPADLSCSRGLNEIQFKREMMQICIAMPGRKCEMKAT